MTNRALDRLRQEIRSLPEAERVELAHDLVKSLDGEPDPDVTETWDAEILNRLDGIDQGNAELIERSDFLRLFRERIKKV